MTTNQALYACVVYLWISLVAVIVLGIMATAPVFGDADLQSFFPWLVNPAERRILLVAVLACITPLCGMLSGFQYAKLKLKG